jgi:hypothetical protein
MRAGLTLAPFSDDKSGNYKLDFLLNNNKKLIVVACASTTAQPSVCVALAATCSGVHLGQIIE